MRRTTIAGLAATALLFAGCGGDDAADEDDATTTTESEATTEAETTTTEADDGGRAIEGGEEDTETEAADEAEDDAPAAEATPDGTALAIGEPAVVDHDATAGMISLEVTVTEVVESSRDDLAAAGFEVDDIEGFVPHFIRYSATHLGGADAANTGLNSEIEGITAEGGTGGTLITVGLDECRNESFPSDAEVGATVESCTVALIPEAGSLASVRWDGELDEGITWAV